MTASMVATLGLLVIGAFFCNDQRLNNLRTALKVINIVAPMAIILLNPKPYLAFLYLLYNSEERRRRR